MQDNNGGAVAGSFNFAAQLPNGKSLTFSGYILAGETEGEINAKLDCAARSVDRQRLIAEVPELEAKVEQLEQARSQITTMLEDLDGKDKLSAQEKSNLNTYRVNLKKLMGDIEKGNEAVKSARALAAAA